jgi:hypothetical protein
MLYIDVLPARRINATQETCIQIPFSEKRRWMSQPLVNFQTMPRPAQTMSGLIPTFSRIFRLCRVTDLPAVSEALGWRLGESGEPKSSSHFETNRYSSQTTLLLKDYAA